MRIVNNNNQTNFKGCLSNKYLLRSLETVANHGGSFTAVTSFAMSFGLRPMAIKATPGVDKENKRYASTSSQASALMKLAVVESVALPVEMAIKQIDKSAGKYLPPETIKLLKGCEETLLKSPSYRLSTQILKLGTGFVTAIPKSMLTVALIPVLMDKLYKNKESQEPELAKKDLTFTSNEFVSKGIAKLLNNKKYQEFVIKHKNLEPDIAKHMSASTDILLSSSYAVNTLNSKKIKEEQKMPLVYNSLIGTATTLLLGYPTDSFLKNASQPIVERFVEANKNYTKLSKCLEGINIIRPALIFASIYYVALPMLSTFLADKADRLIRHK